MPEKRIFAKSGHVCMMCGFKATTKNKYRELQDHLVRRHFQERIKAALPTRRPFMCPDHSCTVEGKDWQALMRHYTGKHGVLEAYIKEFLARQVEHKENLHLGRPVSPLPPTNKIGCRRRRYKRHSSGEQDPMSAEDGTEDSPSLPSANLQVTSNTTTMLTDTSETMTTSMVASPTELQDFHIKEEYVPQLNSNTILQLDDSEPAEDLPPTHLALVLKRRRIGHDGLEEEPEETYAFVDLKYFQPLSANQYVMKSQVIEPSAVLNFSNQHHHQLSPPPPCSSDSPPINGFYLESNGETAVQSPSANGESCDQHHYDFQSFPQTTTTSTTMAPPPPLTHIDFTTTSTTASPASPTSAMYIPSYDQVVPNHHATTPSPTNMINHCASEVEISTADTTAIHYEAPVTVMEVPIQVANLDPKSAGLAGRGCSKVVVETVKSIPMESSGVVTATSSEGTTGCYELISHDGIKEIDFTMF